MELEEGGSTRPGGGISHHRARFPFPFLRDGSRDALVLRFHVLLSRHSPSALRDSDMALFSAVKR